MTYVDGFVLCVPKNNATKYKKMASDAGKVWKKFGAVSYVEAKGEEMNPPNTGGMKSPNFPKIARASKTEDVWFSFITYKNKPHRNQVNKKVMDYFKKKYGDKMHDMPFDMKKLYYGGFDAMVDL